MDEQLDILDIEEDKEVEKLKDFFVQRVTELRMQKGLSEVQMSYELGNGKNYVHNMVNGLGLPRMAQFFRICNYFEITPEEFFNPNLRNPSKIKTTVNLLEKLNDGALDDLHKILLRLFDSNGNT